MNNDLISREALKKKLSDANYQTYTHEYGYAIPTEWVMNAIDNAPTVSEITKEKLSIAYDQGYKDGRDNWLQEEHKGDLISREALTEEMRKSINERYPKWDKPITVADIATLIFDVIDNAPTVDIWQLRQEATENALKKAEVLYGRPKGEWIEIPVKRDLLYNTGIKYTCSICGKGNCYGKPPFCMYCGADMRKGDKE